MEVRLAVPRTRATFSDRSFLDGGPQGTRVEQSAGSCATDGRAVDGLGDTSKHIYPGREIAVHCDLYVTYFGSYDQKLMELRPETLYKYDYYCCC